MARHVFYSSLPTLDERFAGLSRGVMTFGEKYSAKRVQKSLPQEDRSSFAISGRDDRQMWIAKISAHFRTLSCNDLKMLTGRDLIKMHRSQITSTYRNALISEAIMCLHNMTDEHLRRIYHQIPFSVIFVPARGNFDKKRVKKRFFRVKTAKVTKKQLDRELDDYFRQDPLLYKAKLDAELEEYMKGREDS